MFLRSWETPAAIWPSARSFSERASASLEARSSAKDWARAAYCAAVSSSRCHEAFRCHCVHRRACRQDAPRETFWTGAPVPLTNEGARPAGEETTMSVDFMAKLKLDERELASRRAFFEIADEDLVR